MINNQKDWLRKNGYQGNWHRVLSRGGGDFYHQVEVNLTPVNDNPIDWDTIGDIFIRRRDVRHSYLKDKSVWTHHLPENVYQELVYKLGPVKTNLLFNGDIYPLIDWNKFAEHDNGGCPLSLCRKDFNWYFEQTYLGGDVVVKAITNEHPFILTNGITRSTSELILGGVSVHLPEEDLLIYGVYRLDTGYVNFSMTNSRGNQNNTMTLSQRLKSGWEEDLVKMINQMRINRDIDSQVESSILKMIKTAKNNLLLFNNEIGENNDR